MAAGDWDYIGVEQVMREDEDHYLGFTPYCIEARHPASPGAGYVRLRIYARWDKDEPDVFDALRVVVDGVTVESGHEFARFIVANSALLTGVPFRRLFSQAAVDLKHRTRLSAGVDSLLDSDPQILPDFRELRKEWPKGDTRKVASWAGYLYAAAVADGQPATKAVEDAFGVSKATARRMIARARELDFLADDVVGAPVPSRTRKGHDNEQGTS